MKQELSWVKLPVALFVLHASKNKGNLETWTMSLAECLAENNPQLNEFGALLIEENLSFRKARSEDKRKAIQKKLSNSAENPQAPSSPFKPLKAPRKRAEANPKEFVLVFPETLLAIDGFTDAWNSWVKHRAENKKPLTEETAKSQLKQLSSYHDPLLALTRATSGQWQGLNLDKYPAPSTIQPNNTQNPPYKPAQQRREEGLERAFRLAENIKNGAIPCNL